MVVVQEGTTNIRPALLYLATSDLTYAFNYSSASVQREITVTSACKPDTVLLVLELPVPFRLSSSCSIVLYTIVTGVSDAGGIISDLTIRSPTCIVTMSPVNQGSSNI